LWYQGRLSSASKLRNALLDLVLLEELRGSVERVCEWTVDLAHSSCREDSGTDAGVDDVTCEVG
jgi:hypothetical protein